MVEKLIELAQDPFLITPGYADFCQIVTIKNTKEEGVLFPSIRANVVAREHARKEGGLFHTAYEARNEAEVPVLVEWVSNIEKPPAGFIHLILYSKEQLEKEGDRIHADWGIVSINGGIQESLAPMKPITALRNALGVEEGGSGVSLDRERYRTSVAFWKEHIAIRD